MTKIIKLLPRRCLRLCAQQKSVGTFGPLASLLFTKLHKKQNKTKQNNPGLPLSLPPSLPPSHIAPKLLPNCPGQVSARKASKVNFLQSNQ